MIEFTTPQDRLLAILLRSVEDAFGLEPLTLLGETKVAVLDMDSLAFTEAIVNFEDRAGVRVDQAGLAVVGRVWERGGTMANVAALLAAQLYAAGRGEIDEGDDG